MLITLSRFSSPSIFSHLISFDNFDLFKIKELNGKSVWFIKEDLPDPETPVMQVNKPTGISVEIFFKLFSCALIILILFSFGVSRFLGALISFFPDKYFAVIDFLFFNISSREPLAHISPPWTPAPGPISIIKSAHLIASSSCSTTITVLPRFLRFLSVFISFSLSRWWRPIDGSSRT